MRKTDPLKEAVSLDVSEDALLREQEIEWQMMRIFISQHPYVIASYAFGPLFVIGAFWFVDGQIPRAILGWYVVCLLFMLARIVYHRLLVNIPPSIKVMRRRKREMTFYYSALIPFLWAYPATLITPDNLPMTLAIVCSSIFLVIGLVSNTLTLPRLYISYTVVHMSIMITYLLSFGFPLLYYYVFLMLISVVSIFLMGLVNYRSILASIKIQFENANLLAEVTQQNIQIKNANRAKSRFLVAASHDLSQPLNALSLSIDVLNKQSDTSDLKVMSYMRAAVGGLRKLFNDILDVSRLDSATVEIDIKPINIQELVDSLLMEFETLANDKNINLRSYVYDKWVMSDERQLERVVRNLLSNAIKYTPEGGGVLIGTRNHKDSLRLEVWDNGTGIDVSEQENIFEEFYQVGNAERDRSKGIGLGLSIVQRICTLLEHKLIFKSNLDEGTLFAVVLPLADDAQQHDFLSQSVAPLLSKGFDRNEGWSLNGYSVLVVDDEIMICEVLKSLFVLWGAKVNTATSLAEVEAHIKKQVPDILITDYWLTSGETGAMVVDQINKVLERPIPTIYITGTTSENIHQSNNNDQSNVAVLFKPIDANELQQQLITLMTPTANIQSN